MDLVLKLRDILILGERGGSEEGEGERGGERRRGGKRGKGETREREAGGRG